MARQKIRIKLRAFDHSVLDQSAEKIVETARRTGAKISGPVPLPTERSVFTVLTAPNGRRTTASSSRCAPTSA